MKYPLLFILTVLGLISGLAGWLIDSFDAGLARAYQEIDEKL